MKNLSKAQVIALFLGAAAAEDEVLTPLSAIVALGTEGQYLAGNEVTLVSSGTACTGNAECTTEGEKCAAIFGDGSVSGCINEEWCGMYGRIANTAFTATCYADVGADETAVKPDGPDDVAAFFADVESLITKTTINFDSEQNILISPRLNYQDGWFLLGDVWEETDKPSDNRCFLDIQCPTDSCCAHYPDSNNRRCIVKEDHLKTITLGPVTFTPSCPTLLTGDEDNNDGGDQTPENAQDDIAAGALSEANEELDKWAANELADAKKEAGYDDLSAEDAAAWDAEWEAQVTKYNDWVGDLKASVGYDDLEDGQKAVFEADLLQWQKDVFSICDEDPKAIECQEAQKFREERAELENEEGYFTKDEDDRAAFDANFAEQEEKNKAAITAAWRESNKPASGKEGGFCTYNNSSGNVLLDVIDAATGGEGDDAEEVTCEVGCCGASFPVGASAENALAFSGCGPLAAANADGLLVDGQWTDGLGVTWQHECEMAIKLASSAVAAGFALYYM